LFEDQVLKGHLREMELPERMTCPLLLEVSHLCKKYGGRNIFSDISFTVHTGERVLLCGANGSGKSTLLRVILGLLPADAGNVYQNSQKVAFALQEEADLPLTGDEVLADLRAEHAVDDDKMKEHLKGFGVTAQILERPLCEWSMGERKKFYLAAAFAQGGELLVLDEPTNHIDAAALEYLYQQMAEYPGALLAVSHREGIPVTWNQVIALEGGGQE
ncbi:MAG: ATP-binding cassette domain-containing protein, partial [Lachnospiraceae bacterium]|nr:ATP-binding cassette domain-containing protein [Lachnospiraceae bacterium]